MKRKAYYKKNNYNIVGCDSYNYNKDVQKWKTINGSSVNRVSCDLILDEDDEDEDEDNEEDITNTNKGKCLLKMK
jgi:hypothetical protein